ncbi:MAG: hypothetical protein VX871_02895 [Pseudomonadota bacterium]|nr:hypothetical protein [Pseudomonadota bacterium]
MENARLPGIRVRVAAPGVCPKASKPVCGINGNSYESDFERIQASEARNSDGACRN